jgi:NADH-quinone oxidoreductase subunit E
MTPITNQNPSHEPFAVPPALEAEMDTLIGRYPQKRSAVLMLLHALQEHFGWISPPAMDWTAAKLGIERINVYELITFYPMFRQAPAGRHQFKVCRTLSCALGGSHALHRHLCQRFALNPDQHTIQTTPDGRFSVEFVECLAACGTAPVMMVNDDFYEGVTAEQADQIAGRCP